jgi:hypothetical protein
MTSKISFATFPTQYHPKSSLVSQMHTTSSATTTTNMTHCLSTHGLHVYELPSNSHFLMAPSSVLDPQISYKALKTDYVDDLMLSDHLEQSKANLFNYFDKHYANANTPMSPAPSTPVPTTPPLEGLPQKSFTAQYCRKEKSSHNELEEYFKLPAEDFNTCNPIHWWGGLTKSVSTPLLAGSQYSMHSW